VTSTSPDSHSRVAGSPGKPTPEFAHRAAAAVAADEVTRAQLGAVGQVDGHPVVVLTQPDQFTAAADFDAQLGGVLDEQALCRGLWDAEDIRMSGVQPVRCRLVDSGEEATDRVLRAERKKPVQQAPLVQHLDAACVQAESADDPGRLRLSLQYEHAYAVQPQLARQHHAGGSTTDNSHVEPHSCVSSVVASAGDSAAGPGACRKPPCALDPGVRELRRLARSVRSWGNPSSGRTDMHG
jgi:hypothetical protein